MPKRKRGNNLEMLIGSGGSSFAVKRTGLPPCQERHGAKAGIFGAVPRQVRHSVSCTVGPSLALFSSADLMSGRRAGFCVILAGIIVGSPLLRRWGREPRDG